MHRRIALLTSVVASVCVLCLAQAPGAAGAITSTRITSPGDPTYLLQEDGNEAFVTVSGTVTSSGVRPGEGIELRCYSEPENSTAVEEVEEEELVKTAPKTFTFSVVVPVEELGEAPCVLRAVPEDTNVFLAPGASTQFEGPRVAYSETFDETDPATGATTEWDIEDRTLSGFFEIDNAGQCGLGPTELLSSPGLAPSARLFRCMGALRGRPAGATRSDIQVDGRNAYDAYAADALYNELKPAGVAPSSEFEPSFEYGSGLARIDERDQLVECKGTTVAYPETSESCKEFVDAGVTLERTWTPGAGGRLIEMNDTWRSTDGSEHTVSALYRQELESALTSPGTFEFPDASPAFAETRSGETFALGTAATILYREDGTAAEAAGGTHPVAGLILTSAPSEAVVVTHGSAETAGSATLTTPYLLSVAPGKAAALSMSFAEGYTTGEVCALAEAAGSHCPEPLSGGGEVNTETPPSIGTDTSAQTPAPVARTATALRDGSAKVEEEGAIVVSLSCSGPAGTSCSVTATLETVEKLRGRRIVSLTASRRSRTVIVGSSATRIPAGSHRTITIRLNAAGRALLARFHRLPVHLAVVQRLGDARASVDSQSLAVAPRHR